MMYRHLTMAELLELRDREGSQQVRDHVASCAACAREYERLHQRVAALRALPTIQPPRDRWAEVHRSHRAARWRATWRAAGITGLAAAAMLVMVVGIRGLAMPRGAASPDTAPQLEDLMAESQRLESLLQLVGQQERVMSGMTAATIADLEDRIALIDEGIARAVTARYPADQVRGLWGERVALMGTLVNTHVRNVAYVGY